MGVPTGKRVSFAKTNSVMRTQTPIKGKNLFGIWSKKNLFTESTIDVLYLPTY